jgi:uncharacterized membrane protein
MAAQTGPRHAGDAVRWQHRAVAAVAALALLELLWELWLAPLRPGGSWLALKALPLALLWPGLSRGATKAGQWLALLLPLYVAEAIVRALTEGGRHRLVAWAATLLAGMAFVAVLASFRAARRDRSTGR